MHPNDLNTLVDKLGDRFNLLGNEVPQAELRRVQQFLTDWQDYYFGEYDIWNLAAMPGWETQYAQTKALVDRLESAHGTRPPPRPRPTSEAPGPAPISLPGSVITAKRPWWYFALWGGAALLAVKLGSQLFGKKV